MVLYMRTSRTVPLAALDLDMDLDLKQRDLLLLVLLAWSSEVSVGWLLSWLLSGLFFIYPLLVVRCAYPGESTELLCLSSPAMSIHSLFKDLFFDLPIKKWDQRQSKKRNYIYK